MTATSAAAKERHNGWSIAASAMFHILLCLFVLLLPVAPDISPPQEKTVEVEIVLLPALSKESPSLSNHPAPPKPTTATPTDKPEARSDQPTPSANEQPREETPAMVTPSRMLSEKVLSDPRSGKSRKKLATLAPADQIEQLCGLEAMAQLAASKKELRPDRVIAYAMGDPRLSGNAFIADGAAVHSKREWYRLHFRCELTPDHKKVAAFAFRLSDPIPQQQWSEHNLPDEAEPLD